MNVEDMANQIKSGDASLSAVVQVKRAATGKVEEYTLIFTTLPEDGAEPEKEVE